jgi:hypothetical protein
MEALIARQSRSRDPATPVTAGGLIRLRNIGGTTFLQINTAATGGFETLTNAFAVSAAGDLGVGTTTPGRKLHVVGTSLFDGAMSGVSTSNFFPQYYFNVTDTFDAGSAGIFGNHAVGMTVQQTMASGVGRGNRIGLLAILVKDANTGSGLNGTHDNYHAIFGNLTVTAAGANDGGTALVPKGVHFGGAFGVFGVNPPSPVHWYAACATELDVSVPANVSVREKIGLQISQTNEDASLGSHVDAGILFANDALADHPGWKALISIGKPDTPWPMNELGSIIAVSPGLYGIGPTPYQAAYGINLQGITFSQRAFASTGFDVFPDGTTYARALRATSNTGLQVMDTDESHALSIAPGSNLSANRTLTVNTGDSSQVLDLAWTNFAPSISTTSGPMASVTVTKAKYLRLGKMVTVILDFTLTNSAGGGAAIEIVPPVAAEAGLSGSCCGKEVASTGWIVGGQVSNAAIFITKFDGTTAIGTGYRFMVTATYVAA